MVPKTMGKYSNLVQVVKFHSSRGENSKITVLENPVTGVVRPPVSQAAVTKVTIQKKGKGMLRFDPKHLPKTPPPKSTTLELRHEHRNSGKALFLPLTGTTSLGLC